MSIMPDRIIACVFRDDEWHGQWCEQGSEPSYVHAPNFAYRFAAYVRADLCDAVENEWRKDWLAMRDERDAAVRALSEASRACGLAEGRLAASEMAGVLRGWQERAEKAEAERDRFEVALARACLVGGQAYLVERFERAEAVAEQWGAHAMKETAE